MFGKKKKDKKEKDNKKVDEALNEAIKDNNIKEEVKEKKQEEKEKKKVEETKLNNKFNSSIGALLKIFAGVVLVVLGFVFIFQPNGSDSDGNQIYLRETVSLVIFGAAIVVYGITRLIYLIKAKTNSNVKWVLLLEVLIDVVIGVLLFLSGIMEGFTFISKNFRFFLGAVFYLRGLLYFICTTFMRHETNVKEFVINVILFTFGVVAFSVKDFDIKGLSWILVVLAFLSGAYTLADGSYYYIKNKKREDSKKSKKKEKEKAKEDRDTKEEKIIIEDRDSSSDSKYAN